MKNTVEVPQKLKIKFDLYDPAIPLLGIHPKELKAGCLRLIYILMFIAASFSMAKR